jgi:hypothetical protein
MTDRGEKTVRYARARQTAWRRIGDETVVINLESKRMVALNESGSVVWDALETGADLAALAARLGGDGAAADQVHGFVEALAAEGLVEETGEEAALADDAPRAHPGAFVPPAIAWSEELLRFGGACNKYPDVSEFCNQLPKFS